MNYEVTVLRTNHGIDPVMHIWGWEIPVYLFLGGAVAGLLVLAGVFFLRRNGRENMPWVVQIGPLLAPILLTLGMTALFLDLEHKLYTWRLYLTFEWTSPMSWGSWALVLIYPVNILFALLQMPDDWRNWLQSNNGPAGKVAKPLLNLAEKFRHYEKLLAVLMIALGGFIGIYTGILLSTFVARPFWNSPLLGFLFLTSGLSAASALALLGSKKKEEIRLLLWLDLGFLLFELLLLVQIIIGFLTGSGIARDAGSLILGGPYTGAFWSLVVVAGLILPIFIEIFEVRGRFHFKWVTPILVLAGGFMLRVLFVYIGQHSGIGY